MTWVPNVNVFIAPMKIQLDVDYLLRVVEVIMKASKPQDGTDSNRTTTTRANDQLQYVTYHGSGTSRLTYIEKLFIAPLWFEVEINIKPDDSSESEAAGEAALTLSTIARSTNSATAAGILGWVVCSFLTISFLCVDLLRANAIDSLWSIPLTDKCRGAIRTCFPDI